MFAENFSSAVGSVSRHTVGPGLQLHFACRVVEISQQQTCLGAAPSKKHIRKLS